MAHKARVSRIVAVTVELVLAEPATRENVTDIQDDIIDLLTDTYYIDRVMSISGPAIRIGESSTVRKVN